jgi:hypothetical protein
MEKPQSIRYDPEIMFRFLADASDLYFQQDRHCTYYVTLRSVRATIVAVKKQSVLHIPSVYL